jgi:hypothetical protein
MAKQKKSTKTRATAALPIRKTRYIYFIGSISTLLIIGFSVFYFTKNKLSPTTKGVGTVNSCVQMPIFPKGQGLSMPYAIDLRATHEPGFYIVEAKENGRRYKNPQWNDWGTLGPYALDDQGAIFLAGIPAVSLKKYPKEAHNKILKVDSQTGMMEEWLTLPASQPLTNYNPYGIIGLTLDCESGCLFVSTIAGSDHEIVRGVIYSIDISTKQIIDQYDHRDALGLGLYVTKSGKRLFWGEARRPVIKSVEISKEGKFMGGERDECYLGDIEGASNDGIHRIRFFENGLMEAKGIEFSFSLMAASDIRRNLYSYAYDATNDKWEFQEMKKQ